MLRKKLLHLKRKRNIIITCLEVNLETTHYLFCSSEIKTRNDTLVTSTLQIGICDWGKLATRNRINTPCRCVFVYGNICAWINMSTTALNANTHDTRSTTIFVLKTKGFVNGVSDSRTCHIKTREVSTTKELV